jgi:hypothetical protein
MLLGTSDFFTTSLFGMLKQGLFTTGWSSFAAKGSLFTIFEAKLFSILILVGARLPF